MTFKTGIKICICICFALAVLSLPLISVFTQVALSTSSTPLSPSVRNPFIPPPSPHNLPPHDKRYWSLAWDWVSYGQHKPKPTIEEWFRIKETQRDTDEFLKENKTLSAYNIARNDFDIPLSKLAYDYLQNHLHNDQLDDQGTKWTSSYLKIHAVKVFKEPRRANYKGQVIYSHTKQPDFAAMVEGWVDIGPGPSEVKIRIPDNHSFNIGGVHDLKWDGKKLCQKKFFQTQNTINEQMMPRRAILN